MKNSTNIKAGYIVTPLKNMDSNLLSRSFIKGDPYKVLDIIEGRFITELVIEGFESKVYNAADFEIHAVQTKALNLADKVTRKDSNVMCKIFTSYAGSVSIRGLENEVSVFLKSQPVTPVSILQSIDDGVIILTIFYTVRNEDN